MPRMLVTTNWIYILIGMILIVASFGYAAYSAERTLPAAQEQVEREGGR
jgi:hypothetical protein